MVIIEATGKDGSSILGELQGASPGGGLVSSESRPCHRVTTGDLVRHHGWSVVTAAVHDGTTGLTRLGLTDAAAELTWRTLAQGQSAEVRTDAAIDPGTLHRLRPSGDSLPAAWQATGEAATAFAADVAALPKEGEPGKNGEPVIIEGDDAYETLTGLIGDARALLGQEPAE